MFFRSAELMPPAFADPSDPGRISMAAIHILAPSATLTINLWAIFNALKMKISAGRKKKEGPKGSGRRRQKGKKSGSIGRSAIKLRHFGRHKKSFLCLDSEASVDEVAARGTQKIMSCHCRHRKNVISHNNEPRFRAMPQPGNAGYWILDAGCWTEPNRRGGECRQR